MLSRASAPVPWRARRCCRGCASVMVPSRLVVFSAVGTGAVLVAFALLREPALVAGACVLAGATWIAALSSFNVSAQMSLPDWVRARGLATFSAVQFGSLALGSALWGQTAAVLGIPTALLIAAAGATLVGVLDGARAAAIRRRLGSDTDGSLAATGRHGIDRTRSRADHGHGGISRRSTSRRRFPGGAQCARASSPARRSIRFGRLARRRRARPLSRVLLRGIVDRAFASSFARHAGRPRRRRHACGRFTRDPRRRW